MKKVLLSLFAAFATMLANADVINIVCADVNWVEEGYTITGTIDGITVTADKMDGQTTPTYNANGQDLRTYAKNVLTVSSASNITNIVFNLSSQGKKRLTELTPSTGSVTYNTEGDNWTVTWTGNAAEVSLTVGEKATYGTDGATKAGQFDFSGLDVTVSNVAGVASPRFSLPEGTYYSAQSVELTCSTEGASIYYTVDGTTPDATKTLYSAPIVISETTTIKAIAIKDGNQSDIAEATYTFATIPEVNSIAAFLATNTTGAAMDDVYKITCPVTVIYQYNRYMFITDGTTSVQVYGDLDNTYTNGDVLTNICGSVGYYQGTYQLTPVASSFGEATQGTPVTPETVTINSITEDMVSEYVLIKNVTVSTEGNFTDATGSIAAYQRFDIAIPEVGDDTYDVTGFVNIFKGTLQIYPTNINKATSVESVKAVAGKAYAVNGHIVTTGNGESVAVYNLTGKLVATGVAGRDIKVAAKGLYIVKVGNKATKVVVR